MALKIEEDLKIEEEERINPYVLKTETEEEHCFKAEESVCVSKSSITQVKAESDAEVHHTPELLSSISIKTESDTWDGIKSEDDVTRRCGECRTPSDADVKLKAEPVKVNIASEGESSAQLWFTDGCEVKMCVGTASDGNPRALLHALGGSSTCGKAFAEQGNLKAHMKSCTEEKRFVCITCGKSFRLMGNLNSHLRTHTGEKPYVCLTCGKSFTRQDNLTSHLRTHTGERPYVCQACGKSFTRQDNLTAHSRTHTGERPYACETCGKSFAQHSSLKAHVRTHAGKRDFACETCGKRFAEQRTLNYHQRSHAGGQGYTWLMWDVAMCPLK